MRPRTRDMAHEWLYENYPLRRKFCSRCGKWRHLVDFSPKTERILQSRCVACQKAERRLVTGYKLRDPKPKQSREETNRKRRETERLKREKIRQDPEKYKVYLEDKRIDSYFQRRKQGIKPRQLDRKHTNSPIGYLDGHGVWTYLRRFYRELHIDRYAPVICTLNGTRMTPTEARYLKRLETGVIKQMSIAKADEWAVRFGLPLWEIEEAGSLNLGGGELVA